MTQPSSLRTILEVDLNLNNAAQCYNLYVYLVLQVWVRPLLEEEEG